MISLSQIESDLTSAMKAKDQLLVEVLRGLKTRIQNEKIAKKSREAGSASGGELSEDDLVALIRSEVKRRKEAAETYKTGNRPELADKELQEAAILGKYLPKQMDEAELTSIIEKVLSESASYTAKDFGSVMGKLKAQVGNNADGAILAKLLKEKLK